jgi:acetolactate synthase-1/2/3 large subunit
MMDSSPIVCITGQVGSRLIGSDAFQETDITGVTLPITKHNYLVRHAADVASAVREAFAVAKSGRPGPVLIDITKDAQQTKAVFDWDAAAPRRTGTRPLPALDARKLAQAATLVNESLRPVILAGRGVMLSGCSEPLLAFARHADIPIAMTLLGIGGVPASDQLNLGMMGMHGEAWVNHAIQDADLLIACGMRFDDRVTGNLKTYAPRARKIHIDIDPAEIGKNVPVDVGIVADLSSGLQGLQRHVTRGDRAAWRGHIQALKGDAAVRDIKNLPDNGHLYAAHVMHDLWRETGGGAVVVTDVGQHQMWEAQYYHHDQPRSLITSGGLGTMGFALPAAIGAKIARPSAEVWAVIGDGGFQMTLCELATIAQEGVKVNIALVNNGYLGMVRQWQEFFYDRRYAATPLHNPDFVKLVQAYGLEARAVTRRDEVVPAIEAARQASGSVLIDFRVEQEDSVYPMVPAGADLHAMIRRPSAIAETGDQQNEELRTQN